ncbi:unnamed protein product [Ceutorhynchus assimilis]|uniref:Uncharacterized protein n=1 Tax=Ceutorhynchus assimilis TaxID=467358 RepID=A0A9N9QMT6_9CUCU|nr:unnamed protein product [Ceutorhynchus assimilis]
MDGWGQLNTISPSSFYGKKKGRLPPPPQVSDGSDDSDDDEHISPNQNKTGNQTLDYDESDEDDDDNMTLQQIQRKILGTKGQQPSDTALQIQRLKSIDKQKTKFDYIENDISTVNKLDILGLLPEPSLEQEGKKLITKFSGN